MQIDSTATLTIDTATEAARWGIMASKCCFCRRALADAESVRDGIGPVCARKHGYSKCDRDASWGTASIAAKEAQCEAELAEAFAKCDARRAVNLLVYMISASITRTESDPLNMARLQVIYELGFVTLYEHLTNQLYGDDGFYPMGTVTCMPGVNTRWVKVTCKRLSSEGFAAYRDVIRTVGGYWERSSQANMIPAGAVDALVAAIKAAPALRLVRTDLSALTPARVTT